jgi:hypothetical protein
MPTKLSYQFSSGGSVPGPRKHIGYLFEEPRTVLSCLHPLYAIHTYREIKNIHIEPYEQGFVIEQAKRELEANVEIVQKEGLWSIVKEWENNNNIFTYEDEEQPKREAYEKAIIHSARWGGAFKEYYTHRSKASTNTFLSVQEFITTVFATHSWITTLNEIYNKARQYGYLQPK